jgi:hypothetical protein
MSLYNIDTGAWIQDEEEGWVSTKVVSKQVNGDEVELVFEITGGSRVGEVCSPLDSDTTTCRTNARSLILIENYRKLQRSRVCKPSTVTSKTRICRPL